MIDQIDPNKVFHVYPTNDIGEHLLRCDIAGADGIKSYCTCKCNPEHKYIFETGAVIIVHNSFDGREGVEWAKEIIS